MPESNPMRMWGFLLSIRRTRSSELIIYLMRRFNRFDYKGELLRNCLPQIAIKAQQIVKDLDQTNELLFLRIKTKKQEVMFSPDEEYQIFTVYDYE